MKNQRRFVVVDAQNNLSWSVKKEAGETFKTYRAARKRAVEVAENDPGGEVLICETKNIVCADVKPVAVRSAK